MYHLTNQNYEKIMENENLSFRKVEKNSANYEVDLFIYAVKCVATYS